MNSAEEHQTTVGAARNASAQELSPSSSSGFPGAIFLMINSLETGGTEWEEYRDKNKWPEWGRIQWERKGCNSCHTLDGQPRKGPSWKGIWGKMETLNDGSTVLVDEAYVRESMLNPQAKIVKGFEPVMPTFQGLMRDHEIKGLTEFIKTLK